MGIRESLVPQLTAANRIYLPPACYNTSLAEKNIFANVYMILRFHHVIRQTLEGLCR